MYIKPPALARARFTLALLREWKTRGSFSARLFFMWILIQKLGRQPAAASFQAFSLGPAPHLTPWCIRVIYTSAHTEYMGIEMKQGECICPLSWSIHCNFICDGK
jgi:hypothetical protein